MKYTPSTESIPQSSRRAVNEKLLYLIDNNCCEALYRGWGPARAFPEELSELPYIQ